MAFGLIWAQSADRVIGVDGGLPWHLPEDLAHFREVTDGAVVVMGRTTWQSLPERFRPLPGRVNVVLSRDPALRLAGALVLAGVPEVLQLAAQAERAVWVVGGAQVYAALAEHADRAEVTEVDTAVGDGTPAPALGPGWETVGGDPDDGWHTSSTGLRYRFRTLGRASGAG